MPPLTPSLTDRNKSRAQFLADLLNDAHALTDTSGSADLSEHDRTSANVPKALDPAFDAATTAYETPSDVPLGALTVTAEPAEPGAVAAVRYVPDRNTATSIEAEVTAADGATKRKYVITRASG